MRPTLAIASSRLDPLGSVAVLNVGAGDVKLTFDPEREAERKHAERVVTDMLSRGYAILVQVGEQDGEPVYQRAKGFDPATCEYLVVGVDEPTATTPRRRGRPRKTAVARIPAERTRAVSVARTAGG